VQPGASNQSVQEALGKVAEGVGEKLGEGIAQAMFGQA
jgi:hypothetical protein